MTLKEAALFVYGLIFATSTPYLKPKKRFLFPTATWKFDKDFTLFLGGAGICAHLRAPFIVNANIGVAAEQWRADLKTLAPFENAALALSSLNGAFGTPETVAALKPSKVFVAGAGISKEWDALNVEVVHEERVLTFDGETVHLIPVTDAATETDLVVFFKERSVMMFGPLFTNRIHPVLQHGVSLRVEAWISRLENLLERFQPKICVPAEGDVGTADDVREFIRYLRALTDANVEFSYCRKNFDWMEIPSATSLEENFDVLRRNLKTHTSLR